MKAFLKTKKGFACIAAVCVLLILIASYGGYAYWHFRQVKFHDVTVELGTTTVSIQDFMTEYARADQVSFVSDVSVVNLNQVGSTILTLRHGSQEQTVTLTVQDTTAPKAEFLTQLTVPVNTVPEAADFVASVEDYSEVTISYIQAPVSPEDYTNETITVAVTDACGNQVLQDCVITYVWLRSSYDLELGQVLAPEDILYNPENDLALLDQSQLDTINASGIGTYTITSSFGDRTMTCTINVQDTQGPVLEVREVQRNPGGFVTLDLFVKSVTDVSGVAEVRFVEEPNCQTAGAYPVVIEAEDNLGNVTRMETTLWVTYDRYAPVISGAGTTLYVAKHSEPDFLEGVSAQDNKDGTCEVTVDTSGLDMDTAGTYIITYSCADSSGNTVTIKRKVVVEHDQEDTDAMVASIAAGLSDDPEEIRNYVRSSIGYSSNWGGDDPVWYGFTTGRGNCYVHALCLKAIFDAKGIECQLIWVTNETHYWLIVNIDGTWWHIDPTPSKPHNYYSLMNDEQRLATLSGRTWDTEAWPACDG